MCVGGSIYPRYNILCVVVACRRASLKAPVAAVCQHSFVVTTKIEVQKHPTQIELQQHLLWFWRLQHLAQQVARSRTQGPSKMECRGYTPLPRGHKRERGRECVDKTQCIIFSAYTEARRREGGTALFVGCGCNPRLPRLAKKQLSPFTQHSWRRPVAARPPNNETKRLPAAAAHLWGREQQQRRATVPPCEMRDRGPMIGPNEHGRIGWGKQCLPTLAGPYQSTRCSASSHLGL